MRTVVRDVMSQPAEVVALTASFKQVAELLHRRRISGVPVVDEQGRVAGVVSEADLLLKEEWAGRDAHARLLERRASRVARAKAAAMSAEQLMTAPAVTVGPDASVAEAARIMHQRGVKRLVVVDAERRPVGVVTRSDLLRVFLRPDEAIRREIAEDLVVKTLWMPPEGLLVSVEAGVVTLAGEVDRRSDAQLLERMAAQVEGVVAVRSQLSYRFDDSRPSRWA